MNVRLYVPCRLGGLGLRIPTKLFWAAGELYSACVELFKLRCELYNACVELFNRAAGGGHRTPRGADIGFALSFKIKWENICL